MPAGIFSSNDPPAKKIIAEIDKTRQILNEYEEMNRFSANSVLNLGLHSSVTLNLFQVDVFRLGFTMFSKGIRRKHCPEMR